jgi:hypothetical protein
MTDDSNLIIHKEFVAPGVLRVSPEALKYARDFIETVTAAHGDGYIAIFGWADMCTFKTDPNGPLQVVKDFMDLGAISRSEIPPDAIQTIDGVDFAIDSALKILQNSTQRLIDFDENAFARLVLK